MNYETKISLGESPKRPELPVQQAVVVTVVCIVAVVMLAMYDLTINKMITIPLPLYGMFLSVAHKATDGSWLDTIKTVYKSMRHRNG